MMRLLSRADLKEAIVKKSISTFVLLFAFPVLADKPIIQMTPWPAAGILGPTASACGFDILATPQPGRPNKEKLILLGNAGILTGPLFLTVKNLTTGKTVDINISGPAQLTFSVDTTTVVIHGPALGAFPPPPADLARAAGLPLVPLSTGRLVVTLDSQGNTLSIETVTGKVQDLCELLR
jgi:hypothetical protein